MRAILIRRQVLTHAVAQIIKAIFTSLHKQEWKEKEGGMNKQFTHMHSKCSADGEEWKAQTDRQNLMYTRMEKNSDYTDYESFWQNKNWDRERQRQIQRPKKKTKLTDWLINALNTCKCNLVLLLEGLYSSNPCRFEFSGFWVFAGIEPTTSGLTLPRSDRLS